MYHIGYRNNRASLSNDSGAFFMGDRMAEIIRPTCKYFRPLSEDNPKDGLCYLHPPNEVTNPKTGHRRNKVEDPCWCGDYKEINEQDQEG